MKKLEEHLLKNGSITNKEAQLLGIGRHTLARLARVGELERVKNGVYKKTGEVSDDFMRISANNDRVVFSHQSALYLHDLSDRTPNIFHISVPQGYNATHLKKKYENIKIHYVKKEYFEVGLSEVITPMGNPVKVYDRERCICDIVLAREKMDKQIFIDAMNRYFKQKDRDLRHLIKYSRIFGIESEIRKYLEVLS